MRVALAIAVGLACPTLAGAQAAGDRYGPPSTVRQNAVAGQAWRGPALGWANKAAAPPASQGALPAAPGSYSQAIAYTPFQPQVPLPLQHAQPAPSPTQPARVDLVQAVPVPAAAAPAVQPAAPPQRLAAVTPSPAGGATRFYSVHRGYGLTPDAIPELPAEQRYVLIGPPDAPPAKAEDADDATRSDAF